MTQFFLSVSEKEITRPLGEVDILIGMEYADNFDWHGIC